MFRSRLQALGSDPATIALGATVDGEPVGLSLFKTISETAPEAETQPDEPARLKGAWLSSLFVKPEYRNRKIGRALLDATETLLRDRGCPKLSLRYLSSLKTFAFERLLVGEEWEKEQVGTACYAPKQKVLAARSPHFLDYMDRMAQQLPDDCEIFPWAELTAAERAQLEAKIATNELYQKFTPFIDEHIFEPLNSFGLRQLDRSGGRENEQDRGQVIGWMVNHRMNPKVIRFSQLFVDPEFQPLSRGLLILARAIELLPDDQVGSFNFEPTNDKMSKFVQRRLQPYIAEVRRSFVATKHL